jgi:hypothetical protein
LVFYAYRGPFHPLSADDCPAMRIARNSRLLPGAYRSKTGVNVLVSEIREETGAIGLGRCRRIAADARLKHRGLREEQHCEPYV